MRRSLIGLVLGLLLAGPAVAAELLKVRWASVKSTDAGLKVSVRLKGGAQPSRNVELLVQLARDRDKTPPVEALLGDSEPWNRMTWSGLDLTGKDPEFDQRRSWLSVLEAADYPVGQALMLERSGSVFVRYQLLEPLLAGEKKMVTFVVPLTDENRANPLAAYAGILSYWVPAVTISDFKRLPVTRLGLHVLLRSIGLEGAYPHRKARTAALSRDTALHAELATFISQNLSGEDESDPLGVSAAIWRLPGIAPQSMVGVLKSHVVAGKPSTWGARFEAALRKAKETQTLRWSLAMDFVVPRKGPAEVTTRLLGLTVHMLEPPAHADLVLALKTATLTPAATRLAMSLTQTAGSALIRGIEKWPAGKSEAVLTALSQWGVADAAGPLLGGELEPKMPMILLERLGRPMVVAALRNMTAAKMPMALINQLGSEVDERSKLAYDVVSRGGPTALNVVAEKLSQRGYPPTVATTAATLKADPALLERLTWQLQGLLMTPLAWQFEAEALRLLALEGDCLAQLEAAQKSVHPKIVLKQPLYARCQALRAYHLMGMGSQDDAETLIKKAVAQASWDEEVHRRYVAVRAARARTYLDAGEFEKTEAIIAEVDPHHKDRQILGLLADISTARGRSALQSGDKAAAQKHFIEAKRLEPSKPTARSLLVDPTTGMRSFLITILVILLVVGFTSVGLRYLGRVRTQRSFQMLIEEPPQLFAGPADTRC